MREGNFARCLQPSLRTAFADVEVMTLNQFINVAVAEKLAACDSWALAMSRVSTIGYLSRHREKAPGQAKKLQSRLTTSTTAQCDG